MRIALFLVLMAVGVLPAPLLAQQDAPAEATRAPQGTSPTWSAAVPADAAASDGAGGGPSYDELGQLRSLVQQQHDYIVKLEGHIADLDAYIKQLRSGER